MSFAEQILSATPRPAVKAIGIGLLTVVMSLALLLVTLLLEDRRSRVTEARREVGLAWGGGEQLVAGPFLVVPIGLRVTRPAENRKAVPRDVVTVERGNEVLVFLAARTDIAAKLATERRTRGIFGVTVYKGDIVIAGRFDSSDAARHLKAGEDALWKDAFLSFAVGDNRGFTEVRPLEWGAAGSSQRAVFEPGPGLEIASKVGAHARTPLTGDTGPFQYHITFRLKGSEGMRFLPVGQTTVVALDADWPHPSFQGGYLPNERSITGQGFTARWEIPDLARTFPQSWRQAAAGRPEVQVGGAAAFGVSLIEGLDFYKKVGRAVKYAALFIGFVFLAFFLTETLLAGGRIHFMQYFLVGAAQCAFYILLLSFAEQIGFLPAYACAAGATVALLACYGGLVLASFRLSVVLLTGLLAIYGVLYSVLDREDSALLAGSLAAFAAIAITMFATLRVTWFGSQPSEAPGKP